MTSLVAWTARIPYSLLVTLVSALLSVALTWPLVLTPVSYTHLTLPTSDLV